MDAPNARVPEAPPERTWPRAVGLLVVAFTTAVLRPSVLVAIPLLMLLASRGIRSVKGGLLAFLAVVIVAQGARDGVWYAERAWAVLMGGGFVGLSMLVPSWSLSTRALGAVFGGMAVAAAALGLSGDAWQVLDAAIAESTRSSVDTTVAAMGTLRGEQLAPSVVEALYRMAEIQATVFPALVGIGSMAALGVAWWAVVRVIEASGEGLGPVRAFRFNDHLVWVFVIGLLLLVVEWSMGLSRVGSNALVFMGALYALRGAAVFVFLSGGLSLFGWVAFLVGLMLAAPFMLGTALLIGIGDTWLDIRSRIGANAA